MRALLLGARGAVGTVIARELRERDHAVTAAGRTAGGDAGVDLHGDLAPLACLAAAHDVVINAAGIERPGLATGLSTILARDLDAAEVDLLVMLGAGEQHGPAAVDWTAGLIGTELHHPPEGERVPNLRESLRASGPDGRMRTYLRADFPDHVLLDADVRSYLTLSSAPMTLALGIIGRLPVFKGVLARAPHLGSEDWHLIARDRRTGQRAEASGTGQSEATGRLTALAAEAAAASPALGAVTMADLITRAEAQSVLPPRSPAAQPAGGE